MKTSIFDGRYCSVLRVKKVNFRKLKINEERGGRNGSKLKIYIYIIMVYTSLFNLERRQNG
jgi:hypothetical protein